MYNFFSQRKYSSMTYSIASWWKCFILFVLLPEFREAFTLFDKDGDGEIDIDELVKTLKSLGKNPSQEEINELVRDFDANGKESLIF